MARPHEIVRKRNLKIYIPYEKSQLEEIIDQGLLEVVPLSPGGRAVGITMRSIIKYQLDVMGLQPLPDDQPEQAIKANPDKSDRAIAADIGVDH